MQSSQTAQISTVEGSAQVIRGGYFFPAEVGMALEPGDRITSEAGSRVEVEFSGTEQNLVIRNGSAATLFQEVTDGGLEPQWVAGDLYGEQIYFAQAGEDNPDGHQPMDLYGLFGAGGGGDSTFPVIKTAAAAGVAALAINEASDSDSSSNDSASTLSDVMGTGSSDANGSTSGDASSSDGSVSDGSDSATPDDASGGLFADTPLADTPLADTPLNDLPLESPAEAGSGSGGELPLPIDQLSPDTLNEAPLTSVLTDGLSDLQSLSPAGSSPIGSSGLTELTSDLSNLLSKNLGAG